MKNTMMEAMVVDIAACYHDKSMAPNEFEKHTYSLLISAALATALTLIGATIIRSVFLLSGSGETDATCLSQKIVTGVGSRLLFCN